MKTNLNFTQTEVNMIPSVGGIIAFFLNVGVGALYDWVRPPLSDFSPFCRLCIVFEGSFSLNISRFLSWALPSFVLSAPPHCSAATF